MKSQVLYTVSLYFLVSLQGKFESDHSDLGGLRRSSDVSSVSPSSGLRNVGFLFSHGAPLLRSVN